MKKLSIILMVSVLLFGTSMTYAANLWEEDFEGLGDNGTDWMATEATWTKEIRWGLTGSEAEASWISDNGTNKTAKQSFSGWTQNGNHAKDYKDLTGVSAVTSNTDETIQFRFDVTSTSGVTYANRSYVHIDLYSSVKGGYEIVRINNDWNGFKINNETVWDIQIGETWPWGTYIVDLNFSSTGPDNQSAKLSIDLGGGVLFPLNDNTSKKFRHVASSSEIAGPGSIIGVHAKLIYGDAGANPRSATFSWDNMILTPEPATLFLLLAGGAGVFLRRRRR